MTTELATTTLSLRKSISALSSSATAPIDPTFPLNRFDGEKHRHAVARDVITKRVRNGEDLFENPTSICLNVDHFRGFNLHQHDQYFTTRLNIVSKDFLPLPIFDQVTGTDINGHQITEDTVLMITTDDKVSSVIETHFLKITSTGLYQGERGVVPYVNVSRISKITDTPEKTTMLLTEDHPVDDVQCDRMLGLVWGLLAEIGAVEIVPPLEKNLYIQPSAEGVEAYLETLDPETKVVRETGEVGKLLPYLRVISERRQGVIGKNRRNGYLYILAELARVGDGLSLQVVTLPTPGVRTPVAVLTVQMSEDEWAYLQTCEPDLKTLSLHTGTMDPLATVPYGKFATHYVKK